MDLFSHFSIVAVHVLLEKGVIVGGEHELAHFFTHSFNMLHVDSVVFNANQFVHHGLVRPLVQQRSHWIVPSVHDKQLSVGRISTHFGDKFLIFIQLLIETLSDALAEVGISLKPDQGVRPSSHARSE